MSDNVDAGPRSIDSQARVSVFRAWALRHNGPVEACVATFVILHVLIALFFSDFYLMNAQDYNVIHYFDVLRNPEWWSHDVADGAFGGMSTIYLVSILAWLPVLLHQLVAIPLEWIYWMEFLAKPLLILYLLYRIARDHEDRVHLAALCIAGTLNFRILGINLSSYQSNLYINYYAATYLVVFLVTYLLVTRNRRTAVTTLAFVGPLVHPSLGLLGNGFLVAISWGRGQWRSTGLPILAAGAIGLTIEMLLIDHVVGGRQTIATEHMWQSLGLNGHLYFPFRNPGKFVKYACFTGLLVVAAYRLTSSTALRRDLVISAVCVLLSVPAYFGSIWFGFVQGVQLAPMRSSVLLVLVSLVCLGSAKSNRSLTDDLLFAALPISIIYFASGKAGAALACILLAGAFVFLRIGLAKATAAGVALLFAGSPVWQTWQVVNQNEPARALIRHVTETAAPGTVFFAWGGAPQPFRTHTKCQLVTPSPGHGIYWGLQSIMDDELIKARNVLGNDVTSKNLYTDATLASLGAAQKNPVDPSVIARFQKTHRIRYLIQPAHLPAPSFLDDPTYTNGRYSLFDLAPAGSGPPPEPGRNPSTSL